MKKRIIDTIYEYVCFITENNARCISTFLRIFSYLWGIALLLLHRYLLGILFIISQILCTAFIIFSFIDNKKYDNAKMFLDSYSFDSNKDNFEVKCEISKKEQIKALKMLVKLNERMNKDINKRIKELEEEDKNNGK